MLQVSSGFLMKLVKGKKLKSYKLSRLRRFSLEDILNYLTENNEE
jgi:excisionase family DNA binding protein